MQAREFIRVLFLGSLLVCAAGGATAAPSPTTAPVANRQARSASSEVEAAIRAYYRNLKEYNFEAMQAEMTPDFVLTYRGQQVDGAEFLKRHREEERVKGPTASRPDRMKYELLDFKTDVTPELAVATVREDNPGHHSYLNLFVLKRSGNKWLVYRLFHMLVETEAAK
ncbi:MAG: nuclear transport factor 2 family protein [Steroidobacteraceae bacterium]